MRHGVQRPPSRPALNAGKKRRAADVVTDRPAKRSKGGQQAVVVSRSTLNAIPEAASHPRPSRRLLIFGSADHGVLGLGADASKSVMRPRVHPWFEDAVEKGALGGTGAGLETACAGGMHALAVDEADLRCIKVSLVADETDRVKSESIPHCPHPVPWLISTEINRSD